ADHDVGAISRPVVAARRALGDRQARVDPRLLGDPRRHGHAAPGAQPSRQDRPVLRHPEGPQVSEIRTSLMFDMRAPAFGAPPKALYAAALEMAAFGDEI